MLWYSGFLAYHKELVERTEMIPQNDVCQLNTSILTNVFIVGFASKLEFHSMGRIKIKVYD
jgi:hypothetical protein